MSGALATIPSIAADASAAANIMRSYVAPVAETFAAIASLVCVFFVINGGYHYMTSSGNPEQLAHAKLILRNALIGLIIVLAAGTLTAILSHAYAGAGSNAQQSLPALTSLDPKPVSNGLVDILIKAITGLLNNIIQSVAAPFLAALSFFTTSTPMMTANSSVLNLWLVTVGIADVLFVLVVALLGFHVMSYATFGLDEIEIKHLLPQIALIFVLINSSLFMIDGLISLSNAMIHAVRAGMGNVSVWNVLTAVVGQSGGLGVAALLIMVAFIILAVVLLVYYVGRLVTLYVGAVLAPLALLLWLIPSFRDFSVSAAKVYLTTIFVLFVHVIILGLAASLFGGLVVNSPTHVPNTLMAMVVGLATLIALLKTQGLMMQLSYASLGPKTMRKLGGQFITGISYLSGKGQSAASTVSSHRSSTSETTGSSGSRRSAANQAAYVQPSGNTANNRKAAATTKSKSSSQTGTTKVAPRTASANDKPKAKEKP